MIKAIVGSYQYFALVGQVAILVVVLLWLGKVLFKLPWLDKLRKYVGPYSYQLVFILSLVATLSSLFLSEVAKFQPCILCWYQRIFMYPQPILLYIALLKNQRFLRPYIIALNVLGGGIALYHYLLQRFPQSLYVPCSPSETGISVSCVKGYQFYMGYMSFPLMSLTLFVLIIILMLFSNAKNPNRT